MFIVGRCRIIAGYLEDADIIDVECGICAFVFCLSELISRLNFLFNLASGPRSSGHKQSHCGGVHPLRAFVLCSSLLTKALQLFILNCLKN